ncbi:hypothetical protein [Streptomyces cadmiisoli]
MTRALAGKQARRAADALEGLPEGPAQASLLVLVDHVIGRQVPE